ncbi:hypothetical protein D9M72_583370 [compost metagenome]
MFVAVVGWPIDIDHFGHRQDLLEPVEDKRTAIALAVLRVFPDGNVAFGLGDLTGGAPPCRDVVITLCGSFRSQQGIRP